MGRGAGSTRRTTRRPDAAVAALLALLLVAGACSSSSEDGAESRLREAQEAATGATTSASQEDAADPGPEGTSTPDLVTYLEEALDEDGRVGSDAALRAIEAVFGPIGLTAAADAAAPAIEGTEHLSQSYVLDLAARHWVDFSAAQQTAVARAVLGHADGQPGEPAEAVGVAPDPADDAAMGELGLGPTWTDRPALLTAESTSGPSHAGFDRSDENRALAEQYRDTVGLFISAYQRLMGVDIDQTIRVRVVSAEYPVGVAFATTDPFRVALEEASAGEPVTGTDPSNVSRSDCFIQVGTALARRSAQTVRAALAHEAFHCVQYALTPDGVELPSWLHEGSAAWAGEAVANATGGTASSAPWWNRYLEGSGGAWSLYRSAYSAIGFFSHFARSTDMWRNLAAAFRYGSDNQSWLGLVTEGSRDAESFATGPAQNAAWGSRWTTLSPGARPTARREPLPLMGGSGTETLSPPVGNQQWVAEPGADTVVIRLHAVGFGAYRFGTPGEDGGGGEVVLDGPSRNETWCLLERCVCPDGSPIPGGPYAVLAAELRGLPLTVALAQVHSGYDSAARITFQGLDELCDEESEIEDRAGPWVEADGSLAATITGGQGCAASGREILTVDVGDEDRGASIFVSGPVVGANRNVSGTWWLSADDSNFMILDARTTELVLDAGMRSGTLTGVVSGWARGAQVLGERVIVRFAC